MNDATATTLLREGERDVLSLPGFVTAHSHAFQRALRGRTQRTARSTGTFWSWREAMYDLATSLSPESIAKISRVAFDELRAAGVCAVGEFHYVHHQPDGTPYAQRTLLSEIVISAALDAGLSITLLRTAYARAGFGQTPEPGQRRFCDRNVDDVLRDVDALRTKYAGDARVRVGVAPHSLRAVPPEWITACAEYCARHALPLHMHVAEVEREVSECIAEYGRRPVEVLSDLGALSDRFTAVHATNLLPSEATLLGSAKAFACVCPTTERDLGDGLADLASMRSAGVRLCLGVDSHVVIDHLEDLRALETHERLRLRKRVSFEPAEEPTPALQLLRDGSVHGARSIGFCDDAHPWTARTIVPLPQRSLELVEREFLVDGVVFGASGLRFETRA